MAIIKLNYLSKCLMRTVDVDVILPIDTLNMKTMHYENHAPFPTLYLLHGIFGDQNDWLHGTRIQRWANEHHLCVIMPSGENMFYVDNTYNHNLYGQFVGQELVEITRQMFPLSLKKEETFIAGLSMGGYGAIVNGLKYHDTFGYVAGLSSALMLEDWLNCNTPLIKVPDVRKYYESIFGDLSKLKGSDKDYFALVENQDVKDLPHMYMCVGTEDSLLQNNRDYRDFLLDKDVDLTYEEGPGGHEWDFWDCFILKILNWLPLNTSKEGLNSGNVQ